MFNFRYKLVIYWNTHITFFLFLPYSFHTLYEAFDVLVLWTIKFNVSSWHLYSAIYVSRLGVGNSGGNYHFFCGIIPIGTLQNTRYNRYVLYLVILVLSCIIFSYVFWYVYRLLNAFFLKCRSKMVASVKMYRFSIFSNLALAFVTYHFSKHLVNLVFLLYFYMWM